MSEGKSKSLYLLYTTERGQNTDQPELF